jgi:phenylpyruvate tautomerase PptA (4-oxalocrotonate tautomerase family)
VINFHKNGLLAPHIYIKISNPDNKDMKAQKKLTAGIAMVIVAVLVASKSIKHVMFEKIKYDRIKIKLNEDVEKAKLKKKQEAIRDLSSGAENIR